MIAIVSDIHGNLEALEVVLADIERQGIDEVWCLGDVIGYGPDPEGCLAKAMAFRHCLLGNHEEAILQGAYGMHGLAKAAIQWTEQQLRKGGGPEVVQQMRFIDELPLMVWVDDVLLVHGSPLDPTAEYVLQRYTEDLFGEVPQKVVDWFAQIRRICFVGHTHVPAMLTDTSVWTTPDEFGHRYVLDPERRYLCNVGSVGQPRDGDNRACYVTFDGQAVQWHRLEYPFDQTAAKIRAIPGLMGPGGDNAKSAKRLENGK